MSRRRPSTKPTGSCAENALSELCTRLGYCIPPDAKEVILDRLPADAEAFVDAVLIAEGRDPVLIAKDERRQLLELVTGWVYDGGHGRGTDSGLPVFPSAS